MVAASLRELLLVSRIRIKAAYKQMVNDQGDTSACCKYDTRNTFAILPALYHTDHDAAKLLT